MSQSKQNSIDGEGLLRIQKGLMRISGDKPRFQLVFELGIIILIAVCYLSYRQISNYMSFVAKISQVDEMRSNLLQARLSLKEAEAEHREFVLAGTRNSVLRYNEAQTKILEQWNSLEKLAKKSTLNFNQQNEIRRGISEKFVYMTETMKFASAGQLPLAKSRFMASDGNDILLDINSQFDKIDKELYQAVKEQRELLASAGSQVNWVIFLGTGLAILLLFMWRNLSSKEKAKFEGLSILLGSKQNELVEAQNKAEEADQIKTDFLNNMSHEIRTPLNAIFGLGQLMKKTNLNSEQDHYLDGIQGSARSLLDLVNGVLDFARIENHGLDLHMKSWRLPSLLKEVRDILLGQAELKGLELRIVNQVEHENYISDPVRLRQVLLNLAGNALKFTQQGYVEIRVSASLSNYGSRQGIRFEVMDTGIGISKEAKNKLFQNFYQTDSSISRKFGGTGLGLAISKAIVVKMEGQIGFESEPQKGSTFWFEIPMEVVSPEIVLDENLKESILKDTDFSFPGLRVMIIEDNRLNQVVLSGFLKQLGCEVSIYESGALGLQALTEMMKKNVFPVVFVDCQMPEMDGFQVTRAIRELDMANKIWVVATTAHTASGYREKCLQAGMNDFLSKPILQEELGIILKRTGALSSKLDVSQAPVSRKEKLDKRRWEKWQSVPSETGSFLQEIVKIFMESFPVKSQELKLASDHNNFPEIRDLAHFLKSSCADIGAMEMSDRCSRIESWVESQKNLDQIPIEVDMLLQEFTEISAELQQVITCGYLEKKNNKVRVA